MIGFLRVEAMLREDVEREDVERGCREKEEVYGGVCWAEWNGSDGVDCGRVLIIVNNCKH